MRCTVKPLYFYDFVKIDKIGNQLVIVWQLYIAYECKIA